MQQVFVYWMSQDYYYFRTVCKQMDYQCMVYIIVVGQASLYSVVSECRCGVATEYFHESNDNRVHLLLL